MFFGQIEIREAFPEVLRETLDCRGFFDFPVFLPGLEPMDGLTSRCGGEDRLTLAHERPAVAFPGPSLDVGHLVPYAPLMSFVGEEPLER